jgi:maltose/maltodextrin transport system substrate-binding protein
MTHYPAEAAVAYLDFFDVTKERRCFEAARKIADTYRKLQLANGTWYQMMDNDTGKPLFDNFLVPSTVILFLDRLNRQYGLTEYEGVKHRAMEWIMAHTMKTFNWQSQFEDGQPNQPYQSLAHAQACEWATYLLTHPDDYPNSLSMALELIRFVEDQFVIWEKQPLDITLKDQLEPLSSKYWVTPCVAEQHQYWMPVNFSASLMVQCYLKAYEVTGNKLYRAKAEDVANALLVVQEMHNGEYPTYLLRPTSTGEFEAVQNVWINCGVYTARSVLALGKALSNGAPGARRNAR